MHAYGADSRHGPHVLRTASSILFGRWTEQCVCASDTCPEALFWIQRCEAGSILLLNDGMLPRFGIPYSFFANWVKPAWTEQLMMAARRCVTNVTVGDTCRIHKRLNQTFYTSLEPSVMSTSFFLLQ